MNPFRINQFDLPSFKQFFDIEPDDFKPSRVIFNNPATIVFWNDGSKTIVKCSDEDTFNEHTGLLMANLKKQFGSARKAMHFLDEFMPKEEGGVQDPKSDTFVKKVGQKYRFIGHRGEFEEGEILTLEKVSPSFEDVSIYNNGDKWHALMDVDADRPNVEYISEGGSNDN